MQIWELPVNSLVILRSIPDIIWKIQGHIAAGPITGPLRSLSPVESGKAIAGVPVTVLVRVYKRELSTPTLPNPPWRAVTPEETATTTPLLIQSSYTKFILVASIQ